MAKIYSNQVIAKNKASVGDDPIKSYRYRGFSSREYKKNYKLNDFDLVKQDILNHFYIRKGEKLENPNFGTIIWDMLMEQFTTEVKNAIAKDVEEIVNYDIRVKVTQVNVDATGQGIRIEISMIYLPLNLAGQLSINFDKNNGISV